MDKTPSRRALLLAPIAALTTLAMVAVPAAAACSSGGLACATVYGSGYLMNDQTGCRLGDFFGSRTCVVQWSWQGVGTATLGGALTVHLNADVTYTAGCAIGPGGSCATGQILTSVTYHISCNVRSVSASVDGQVTGLQSSPQDFLSMSVGIPACN